MLPRSKSFSSLMAKQRMISSSICCSASSANRFAPEKHLSADAHGYLDELKKYTINDVGGNDDYLRLKVFSSKGDRLPTYRVAFGTDSNPKTPFLQTDLQLYVPGKNGVDAFQKYALKKIKTGFSDIPALAIGAGNLEVSQDRVDSTRRTKGRCTGDFREPE